MNTLQLPYRVKARPGEAIYSNIENMNGEAVETPVGYHHVQNLANRRDRFMVVARAKPPLLGASLWMAATENLLFTPDKPKINKQFIMLTAKWEDMLYYILSMPRWSFEGVNIMATRCDLVLKPRQVQMMLDPRTGLVNFPMYGSSVFFVDSIPGSRVYTMTSEEIKSAHKIEYNQIESIYQAPGLELLASGYMKYPPITKPCDGQIIILGK